MTEESQPVFKQERNLECRNKRILGKNEKDCGIRFLKRL